MYHDTSLSDLFIHVPDHLSRHLDLDIDPDQFSPLTTSPSTPVQPSRDLEDPDSVPNPIPVTAATTAPPTNNTPFTMSHPTMPARNHSTAPAFDPAKPRELRRYFQELETLLDAAAIVDEQEKKKQACRYLSVDDAELWKKFPSSNPRTPSRRSEQRLPSSIRARMKSESIRSATWRS